MSEDIVLDQILGAPLAMDNGKPLDDHDRGVVDLEGQIGPRFLELCTTLRTSLPGSPCLPSDDPARETPNVRSPDLPIPA